MRPGPIIRPVRRARVRQRRQTFGALVVVLTAILAWQFWPSAGQERAVARAPSPEGTGTAARPHPPSPPNPDSPIQHVIFLVKENRSFDHYFGTYPGADGATDGGTIEDCERDDVPGRSRHRPEARADVTPHDITHALRAGPVRDQRREDERLQLIGARRRHDRATRSTRARRCPSYWAYADRFVLADHFFTSMYGPTFPEHLYTVAAQSYGIVDNKTTPNAEGNYCDDPTEFTKRFPIEDLTEADVSKIMELEDTSPTRCPTS